VASWLWPGLSAGAGRFVVRIEFLRRTLLVLAGAAGIAGCVGGTVHSAVMDTDQADLVMEQCSRPNPPHYQSTWKPGPQDVKQLEQDLPALKALAPPSAAVGDPGAYDRQYFGLVVHGKHLIYINAFRDSSANPDKDWKFYAMVFCEANGAWGAVYDPASRSFSDLVFNSKP